MPVDGRLRQFAAMRNFVRYQGMADSGKPDRPADHGFAAWTRTEALNLRLTRPLHANRASFRSKTLSSAETPAFPAIIDLR
jgi:hypothetical protein